MYKFENISRGSSVTIKIGGEIAESEKQRKALALDIKKIREIGYSVALVFGAKNRINENLARFGEIPKFKDGQRITTYKGIDAAVMSFNDLGMELKKAFDDINVPSRYFPNDLLIKPIEGLGYVGNPYEVNIQIYAAFPIVPIIAPIGFLENSKKITKKQLYNINADFAASCVAISLQTDYLIYLTSIDSVLVDFRPQVAISTKSIDELIEKGYITDGMIPKLIGAKKAAVAGVNVSISNGFTPNTLYEMLNEGIIKGTRII